MLSFISNVEILDMLMNVIMVHESQSKRSMYIYEVYANCCVDWMFTLMYTI